jgi:phage terminase small subunit
MEPTLNDWLFIGEYVKDWRPGDAMRRAGYVGDFASQEAYRRLKKPPVKREIENIRASMKNKVQLNTNIIVDDILNVITADPRDLVEIVTESCRYCHGEGHLYQFTQNEYWRKKWDAELKNEPPPHPMGGTGFNPHRDPHPDCPECFGKGIVIERLKDVRDLSPAAAALYMGVERTKSGLKINMRNKDAAREAAARFLGMNKETHILKDGGKALTDMSDEELEALARGEGK